MAKALRIAAIVASVAALAIPVVGQIVGPVAFQAAVGVSVAAAATAASVAAATLSVAATVATKPPPLGGSATKFLASTSAPLPYVMGRTAVGGTVVYRRTHNTTGYTLPDLQTFGVILSACGPINAIESFTADRVVTSFSGKSAVGSYATWMFQATQLGAAPEASALSINGLFVSSGKTTSAPPGWGAGTKLSGYAAALWTLRYDAKGKQFINGIPQPLWVVEGVKVYDPRLDSTYPGGSGSCRALNEATYVYSTNPYLHALTFALGRWQNGKRVMGIGAPIAGIDVAAFVEGANVAQANAWPVGGVIYSNGGKWGMMKAILQAGAGEPIHLGAQISCLVSTPRVTIATITTDDLVGEASVTATTPRRDRINSVIGRYRSEDHNWEVISADPVTVAAHVTTDGGLRTREIEYPLVQNLYQVATLARYDIENAREFGPIVLPVKTRWVGYKPGDCIAVTLPEVGLNAQPVVIRNRTLDPDGGVVTLTARSETNAKHAFALGQTTTAPPTPGVTAPPVAPTPGASDWTIASNGLTAGASVTPALVLTGATGDNPVDGVQFEYRLWVSGQAADAGWIDAGTAAPGAVRREITAVLPGTQYDVAVSYLLKGFAGGRRILGPVTTAGVGVPWSGVAGTGRPEDNATTADNLQINSRLDVDLAGYNAAGFSWARVAGINGPPQPWVLQTTAASSGGGTQFIAPRSSFKGGSKVYIKVGVMRTAALTTLQLAANQFVALTGAGIGPLGGARQIVPSAANQWQFFEIEALSNLDAGFMEITFEGMTGNAGTVQAYIDRISYTAPGADVTALSVPSLSVPPTATISFDYTGTVLGGQLPRTLIAVRKRGDTDVSATTTWSLAGSGFTATISSVGAISLTALAATTTMTVISVRDGVELRSDISLTRDVGPPPTSGGGGSGTSASTSALGNASSTSYGSPVGGPITLKAGSTGTINASCAVDFIVSSASPAGSFGLFVKWQWKIVGGSFADAGSEAGESSPCVIIDDGDGNFYRDSDGSITCNRTITGLTNGADYEVQLLGRTPSGTRTRTLVGTISAVGS